MPPQPGLPEHLSDPYRVRGLHDPRLHHDNCGVAFVATLHREPTHKIVSSGLEALCNLGHRGATGSDPLSGDGAGILIQIPDALLRRDSGLSLPPPGAYGVGMAFLPQDAAARSDCEALIATACHDEGLRLLGWRDVPVEPSCLGPTALAGMPVIRQLFVGAFGLDGDPLERRLYVLRRVIERRSDAVGLTRDRFHLASLSSRTLVYKGMLTADQLPVFYPDLRDPVTVSRLAMVHARFSTNVLPRWDLAQPFRLSAHNGEINTLRGNVNWMRARQSKFRSPHYGADISKLRPVIDELGSDSSQFDNALELLTMAGRSVEHAIMMMIPEAWDRNPLMDEERHAFYEFHASLIEPWDGPAAIAFTDGRLIGATLDRNGLRPARWLVTEDGWVVMASEAGVLPIAEERISKKWRLEPGRLLLVDTEAGEILDDDAVKSVLSRRHPYREWIRQGAVHLDELDRVADPPDPDSGTLLIQHRIFGYTEEELKVLLAPMARDGEEPVGSMGNDAPLAVLSERPVNLFAYFKQLFAQVTNPPIDPIREEIVMSLATSLGNERNLFDETPEHAHKLLLDQPILLNRELETLRHVDHDVYAARTIDITWPIVEGGHTAGTAGSGMSEAIERICRKAREAIAEGVNIIILSDRLVGPRKAPIPSLLAVAAVHHHLVLEGTRLRAGIIVESGEPREVHHFATLIGYGASAINPYLLLESLDEMVFEGRIVRKVDGVEVPVGAEEAAQNVVKALGKGLLKTISKMGISTIQSYRGAQIFEAVGLEKALIDTHFTGTASRIGGIGLEALATEALERHARAYPAPHDQLLPVGGVYAWRRDGEHHMWNPETIALVQHAVRAANGNVGAALKGDAEAHRVVRESPAFEKYREYARAINEDAARKATLRGLLRIGNGGEQPIPLEEVEPASEIVKRFCTGAMSLGSISREAHETLAIAMNRLGGRSNTGEGGEDPSRFLPDANGDRRRSAIKQVASGRFGVTIHYLVNADELQIKMAQGAKPGEGGQLPGHKVDSYIGSIRHTTPGVGLISPPPHHDIYSIEDLKQLIYDLRCANPSAQVSVKLVSEVGVGTVAAGVSKANADRVLIAGHDGGTGASPLSSIQAAGVPWEIGLAETQQTLLLNDLRPRIIVQTDGQLKTGRDVVVAAMLGADEMGFSTAPLIATGCIMMRACHLNTCPVGIATQDPELRKRFKGTPEHVVNFFFFVAEEVREILASIGLRSLDEAIGRVDLLGAAGAIEHWKARGVDLTHLLKSIELPEGAPRRRVEAPPAVLEDALDWQLVERSRLALERREPVSMSLEIRNRNRCVGGILSSHIAQRCGADGLAEDSIVVEFEGSAGQSFAGWLAPGVTFTLRGDANDYAGKGLSGGVFAIRPREGMGEHFKAEQNVIVGNTVLYGATAGRAFFRGLAGERFAVRNSGAWTVVEGVGDHGCEYMTGGRVVVLGPTGRNFAAGMSGGVAYVLDEDGSFPARCNMGMVGFEELSGADALELRAMIEEHQMRTGSPVAARVLAEWEELLGRGAFLKVMPNDYKRVLRERAEEEAIAARAASNGEVSTPRPLDPVGEAGA